MTLFPEAGLEAISPSVPGPPGSWQFRISQSSRCFDGHFDGAPILPGVVHLALALSACARQEGVRSPRTLLSIRDVRMKRRLLPGDEVTVILTEGREPGAVRFEIRCQGELATAGVLILAPPEDGDRG